MSPSKPFHIHLSSGRDTADPHAAALPGRDLSTKAGLSTGQIKTLNTKFNQRDKDI
jgi:hypothetical protein